MEKSPLKPDGMSELAWNKFHKLLAKANVKYRDEIALARSTKSIDERKSS